MSVAALLQTAEPDGQRAELWRYANPARLERMVFPPASGRWRQPDAQAGTAYGWEADGEGATLRVPEQADLTLAITYVAGAGAGSTRLNIQVGAGATLNAMIAPEMPEGSLQSLKLQITLAEGARLNYVRVPQLPADSYLFTDTSVQIATDAHYHYTCISDSGAQVRHQLNVSLNGRNAQASFNGATMVAGTQVAEHTLLITHAAPDTYSQQRFRTVADGQARGVFQGKVIVAHGANGTDAQQQHKGLLLNPRAEIDAKPELEIHAHEVKCSHGATLGALDPAALFYFRSRGIAEAEARRLLVQAFVAETIADAPAFADILQARLDAWSGHADA